MINKNTLAKYMWTSGAVLLCIGFIGTAFEENIIFAVFGVLGLAISQIGLYFKKKY
jgi:hypothetical protein